MQTTPEHARADGARRGELLRILGVGFGLAVIIGNTISSGILRTPGEVAAHLPDPLLFISIWIAGGLYALLGAFSISELGTMIPKSGGQYVFAHYALGEYAGFIVGWSDWLSTCGTTAAVSIVIGEYAGALFPALAGRSLTIALIVIIAFALLQWRGIGWGSRVQNFTSLLKTLAFIALVIACFTLGGRESDIESVAPAMSASTPFFIGIIVSLQAVIYTYDGWAGVVYFSEEVRNPARDIPRSTFGGILSIIVIYVLVNLALLYVLPISQMAGENLAAAAAAEKVFGATGDLVIRGLMIISLLSGINACHLMATRVLFAMSRDRLVSDSVVRVNKGGTPTAALFLSTVAAVLFLLSGTFNKAIAVLAFFFVVNYIMSFVSVFVLRRREPLRERPYRAWGYPWTTGLALSGSIAFLAGAVAADTEISLYSLALLAASYPVFRLLKRLRQKDMTQLEQ